MENLLTIAAFISFLTLTLLEIVLGINNVIFITIVASKLLQDHRNKPQNNGLPFALAQGLRCLSVFPGSLAWNRT